VLVIDGRGRIAWQSPQAQRWLAESFADAPADAGARWLVEAGGPGGGDALADATAQRLLRRPAGDGRHLVARWLGEVGLGESMWLLSQQAAGEAQPSRLASAALTPRETEVLSWIAKGKTNRDVADILGMSPRTVNKHLEHVFEKLGVETRAAAAALASRELG
jgi:DNA-binding CsgD family transcriptional regulator